MYLVFGSPKTWLPQHSHLSSSVLFSAQAPDGQKIESDVTWLARIIANIRRIFKFLSIFFPLEICFFNFSFFSIFFHWKKNSSESSYLMITTYCRTDPYVCIQFSQRLIYQEHFDCSGLDWRFKDHLTAMDVVSRDMTALARIPSVLLIRASIVMELLEGNHYR
jgi:hypothetical protein